MMVQFKRRSFHVRVVGSADGGTLGIVVGSVDGDGLGIAVGCVGIVVGSGDGASGTSVG